MMQVLALIGVMVLLLTVLVGGPGLLLWLRTTLAARVHWRDHQSAPPQKPHDSGPV